MGVDYNCYIGPILQISLNQSPKPSIVRQERFCSVCKTLHSNDPKIKYCGLCGNVLVAKDIWGHKKTEFDSYELWGDSLSEILAYRSPKEPAKQEFIPNDGIRKGPRDFRLSDPIRDGNISFDFFQGSVGEEVAWFELAYEKEIKIAREKLGEKNVVVIWGFRSWAS